MRICLQSLADLHGVREIRIDHFPFLIGRCSENDCPLPLAFVSRRHCQLTRTGDEVFVQDLESHNGTFVNGRHAFTPLLLRHGDELHLGPVPFRVYLQLTAQDTAELCKGRTEEEPPSSRPAEAVQPAT